MPADASRICMRCTAIMRFAISLGMLLGVSHGWVVSEGYSSDWLTINSERTMTFPGLNRSFGSESFSAFP